MDEGRLRKGTAWTGGRRDSECPRGEEYEGSLFWLQREAAVEGVLDEGVSGQPDYVQRLDY